MKTSSIHKFLIAIVTIGVVAVWASEAGALRHKGWQKLPKLVLQQCVAAKRAVQHNPFSNISNDFLVITAYKEYGDDGQVIKKGPEPNGNTEALNVYLVIGVLLAKHRGEAIVHNISLVVTEKITDANGNAEPTLHKWILLDLNGDGVLDKGIFSEGTEGTSGSQQGGDIPSDQIQSLQSYFEQAVRNLNKKATEDPSDTCIPS